MTAHLTTITPQKDTPDMDYRLWLLTDEHGRVTLTGWSDTPTNTTSAKADTWPTYVLCSHRSQLADRLVELGLDLAPGHDLNDLDRHDQPWDVYVRHPDITTLRAILDGHQRTR